MLFLGFLSKSKFFWHGVRCPVVSVDHQTLSKPLHSHWAAIHPTCFFVPQQLEKLGVLLKLRGGLGQAPDVFKAPDRGST